MFLPVNLHSNFSSQCLRYFSSCYFVGRMSAKLKHLLLVMMTSEILLLFCVRSVKFSSVPSAKRQQKTPLFSIIIAFLLISFLVFSFPQPNGVDCRVNYTSRRSSYV